MTTKPARGSHDAARIIVSRDARARGRAVPDHWGGAATGFLEPSTALDLPALAGEIDSERHLAPTVTEAEPVRGPAPARGFRSATLSDEIRPNPARANLRFIDAGTIQERLEDEDALRRRLKRDPSDPVAGDALEALYLRRGDHEAVVSLLVDRAEVSDDPAQRGDLLLRAAHLYRAELGDLEAARLVLTTALSAAPGETRIHEELDAVVCASGEFATARAAYADAAMALESTNRVLAGELWLRVASLHIMERSTPAAASASLVRIEYLDGERAAPVLRMCERLAQDLIVLDALVALYQRLGDSASATRVLTLSIDCASDASDRAGRHQQIADLAAVRGDDLEAEWHLAEALRLAPERAGTRTALADLYRRRGEPRRAARLLEEARLVAQNPVDRANLACKAAAIYAYDLGENTAAVNLYELVLANDPDRAEAAAPLAERYWQRGRYAELEPLIEVLVRRAIANEDGRATAELCYRAGKTALELGKHRRAFDYLRRALAADPGRLDALRGWAAAAAALERYDDAYDALSRVLSIIERCGADGRERADVLAELAEMADKRGDSRGALDLCRAALRHIPSHERALASARGLLTARGELAELAALLSAATGRAPAEARVRHLSELAALHARELGEPTRAVELYREALAVAPNDRAALTQLAELYTAGEAWQEAVEVLGKLAEIEPAGLRRGRYLQVAAQLARGRLDDDLTAGLFAGALDAFFGEGEPPAEERAMCLRAFTDLEKLLRQRSAFQRLEQAYRHMIKRLAPGSPELPDLWSRLGAFYREELDQPIAAIEAYEVAAALDDGRMTRHRVLIDLYQGFAPDDIDKLVERRMRILQVEPMSAEHYRALAELHRRAERCDRRLLALRAVEVLGAIQGEERRALDKLEGIAPRWPRSELTPEHHARMRRPDEDQRVTAVLAAVGDAIMAELAAPPRRLRLRDDTSPGWQALRELHAGLSAILGTGSHPLYICPELDVDLVLANLSIGGRAVVAVAAGGRMAAASRAQATHGLVRILAHIKPGYVLRRILSEPGALDAALDAGLMAGGYRRALSPGPAAHQFARVLERRLSPAFRVRLAALVQAIDEPRDTLSIERWTEAVDATCRRIALLVTSDPQSAVAALGRERPGESRRSYEERLADLLVHSCSDEHATIRREIGLAVG